MVTVTKTKVSTLPENDLELQEEDDGTSSSSSSSSSPSSSSPSYKIESDGLIVTSSCLKRVERLIEQRRARDGAGEYFLRVFVDAGGCSGFQYQFEIDDDLDEDEDVVVVSAPEDGAARVVIDETSMGFLNGATLDYVIEMIKSSFVIRDNPNSESACGCGSSFAVKNFSANPATD
jgi:iron-sulfur cluster assembly accessory protein